MFDYFKEALKITKQKKMQDKKRHELLNKDMDYAFLEHLIQKINENPQLHVRVTLKDGTILDCNTTPKKRNSIIGESYEDYIEVK